MEYLQEQAKVGQKTGMFAMANLQVQRQMVWELHTQHSLCAKDIAEIIHADRGWVSKTLKSLRQQNSPN